MKAAIPFLVVAAMLLTGCGENNQPSGANPTASPADYLNNVAAAEKQANKTIDAVGVNKAIESYYVQEGHFPKDLFELVEKGFLPRLPDLPSGLNWQYNTNDGIATIEKVGMETD